MSQIMELSSWEAFKATCITSKRLPNQFSEAADRYELFGPDGDFLWRTTLLKTNPASAEQAEFEGEYKATFNGPMSQFDSDGASMSRMKVAPSGWNFQLRGIEFQTSTLGSIVNRDADNANLSDAVLKLYDAQGTEIVDPTLALTAVKTVVDIEPPYDIYIAGGKLKFITVPVSDVRIAVIGAPDVPAVAGGSKHFVQNANLKFIPVTEGVNADGRAAKWLQYSATYHTNKIRFAIYHDAAVVMPIAVFLEVYKL